ncbi:MAG: hypothetical protein HY509_01080 [Acidobacteria bacterium]|nr:hypothetical protein [Acidobacteriota bacterium]
MDRKTELRLSLYLDGLLPEDERREFEARLERDPELRGAVALHRRAARVLAEVPDLPPGFIERSLTRLEGETAPPTAPHWWRRFWSLETAGLVAAAALVALILYPVLTLRDGVQSPDRQAEPALLPTPERRTAPPVPEDSRRMDRTALPGTPPTAGPPEQVPAESDSSATDAEPPRASADEKVLSLATEPVPSPDGDAATGPTKAPSAAKKEAPPGPEFAAASKVAAHTEAVPFRLLPFPGRVDLGERGYLLVRSDLELARLSPAAEPDTVTAAAEAEHHDGARTLSARGETPQETGVAPPDFSTEMALLLPEREISPRAARFEVRRVRKSGSVLFVEIHEVPPPEPDTAGTPSPSFQLLVLPATDLEIRLVKVE